MAQDRNETRNRRLIAAYKGSNGHKPLSLRECAKRFGLSHQAVHHIIKRDAPELMRDPHKNDNR